MKHVFVSSTFKDMQFERDALHTVAAVSLNNSLSAYGEQVYFGDLRWGVNTTSLDSEEGCRKVLEVCLDEIDDCRPYMIVLVGERYGWIPGGDAIRSAAAAKGIEIGEEMSVTQLEIEYGALLNKKHDGRIFFYFRELDTSEMSAEQLADYASESAHHKAKIDALKARVRETYPDAVRTYPARFDRESGCVVGLEDFLETVTEDLRKSFLSDVAAEENLPWQMRAIRSAERYYFELAKHYHDIEHKPLSVFDGTFAQNEVIVSFVRGNSGTGKSTFLANRYEADCLAYGDVELLPFVLGLDKYSTCEADYFKILLYRLEELCGEEHTETEYGQSVVDEWIFDEILRLAGVLKVKLRSVIDNCSYELQNKLSVGILDREMMISGVEYLGTECHFCKNLDFLIAYSADERCVILPPCFDFSRTYMLGDISEEDQMPLVRMLLRRRHKELDESVIRAITEKGQAASPFYLKLATDRMLMLDSRDFSEIRAMGDGMDNINRYQISLVHKLPDTAPELAAELIRCVANRVGEKFVMRLVAILTYGGIRMSEGLVESIFLARSLPYSSLDFALATRSLSAIISYNPKDKSYAILNREAIPAIENMLEESGYLPVARELFEYSVSTGGSSDLLFRSAAYAGEDALTAVYVKLHEERTYLTRQTDWLIGRMGESLAGAALMRAASERPDIDFSYILSAIPTSCLTFEDDEAYTSLLQTIIDKTPIRNDFSCNINANSLAVIAWCKLVSIKMKVNASDAAGTVHSFIDAGYRTYPMTPYARIMLDSVYYRYLALEAFHTMNIICEPEDDVPPSAPLLDEIEDSETRLLLSSHLFGGFASYLRRAFSPDAEEYATLAGRGYELLGESLAEGELACANADDVAMMIDSVIDDKDDMLRADADGVSLALRLMAAGQKHVNSALLKYLPRILYAAKYTLDTDREDFSPETVNLLRRLCATSRAVAASAVTLDDVLYAAVQMEQSYDILCDRITADEHLALITHLDKFVKMLLSSAGDQPRVLYRCYMPLYKLLSIFDIYGMDDASARLLTVLSELECTDEDAPILPELFVGTLIYRYGEPENEELRAHLRELADTVSADESYSEYDLAYAPELMYIRNELRTEDEIAADSERFSISYLDVDEDDEDIDFDNEELRDEIFEDDDEYDLDGFDDDDVDEFDLDTDDDDDVDEFDLDTDDEDDDTDTTDFSEEEINDMLNFLKTSGFSLEDLLGDIDGE